MKQKISRGALPMLSLTVPMIFEQFFRILVSTIDTFMLSSYSEKAVAAVGMTSQYIFFLTLLFSVVCTGTSIVLSQNLGAEKQENLNLIAKASTLLITAVAAFVTFLVLVGTKPLLACYDIETEVRDFAYEYFIIYGGVGSFFSAFSSMQGAVLRAYGHTKTTLVISIIANLINVVGNALSLYGLFGLPVLGVKGVAASSVLSQAVSCILFAVIIKKRDDVFFNLKKILDVPKDIFKKILSIGIPTAGESIAYNTAQITIMAMITKLGTEAMDAQVYTQTIVRYVFMFAVSIGNAVQIKTGYFVGAGQKDIAYKKLYKYQLIGTCCSMAMILLVNIFKYPIIGILTDNSVITGYVSSLLIYSAYIEFGRSLNLISIGALKGAGDVKFPVLYGICSMWGIMVLGSWILGLKMGLGLVGFWISIGTDETFRGIVMLLRWKSKKWMNKSLV